MRKLRTQLFYMTLLVLMLIPLLGSAATDQKGILSQVDIRTSLAALKSGESGSIDITPVDAFGEPIPLDGLTARFQFVDASGNALSGKPLVLDQALLDNGGSFTVTQTDTGYRLDIVGGGQEALYLIQLEIVQPDGKSLSALLPPISMNGSGDAAPSHLLTVTNGFNFSATDERNVMAGRRFSGYGNGFSPYMAMPTRTMSKCRSGRSRVAAEFARWRMGCSSRASNAAGPSRKPTMR